MRWRSGSARSSTLPGAPVEPHEHVALLEGRDEAETLVAAPPRRPRARRRRLQRTTARPRGPLEDRGARADERRDGSGPPASSGGRTGAGGASAGVPSAPRPSTPAPPGRTTARAARRRRREARHEQHRQHGQQQDERRVDERAAHFQGARASRTSVARVGPARAARRRRKTVSMPVTASSTITPERDDEPGDDQRVRGLAAKHQDQRRGREERRAGWPRRRPAAVRQSSSQGAEHQSSSSRPPSAARSRGCRAPPR